jgi:hypothetical protein
MSRWWMLVGLTTVGSVAWAADPAPKDAPTKTATERELTPATPRFQRDQTRTVGALEGRWVTSGTLTIPGKSPIQISNVVYECKKIANGKGLQCMHGYTAPDEGRIEEAALIGVDPQSGMVHRYSMNSKGEMQDFQGIWTDDRTLTLDAPVFLDGRPATGHLTMTFPTPDQLSIRKVAHYAGGEQASFEVTGKREVPK